MSILFATDHAFECDGETRYCRRCERLRFMHVSEDDLRKDRDSE